nr:NDP-4-ketoreductase [uncultured bacterium]
MEIIGRGFLARSAEALAGAHPDAMLFVSGVSSAGEVSEREFSREAEMLYAMLRRCQLRRQKLVYFSTSSIGMYGMLSMRGREDGPVFPRSAYGRHKLAMESVIKAAGTDYLILRLATPVGLYQRSHQFLPAMVRQVLRGSVHIQIGARRDLIDIEHVMAILDDLLEGDLSREVVNIASGVAVPIEDLVRHLEERLGVTARKQYSEVPSERAVSIAKLTRLSSSVAHMGFGPGYYRSVIDRYVEALAEEAVEPHQEPMSDSEPAMSWW